MVHPLKDFLKDHAWQDVTILLEGAQENVAFFDWFELLKECEDDDADWASDFSEYFSNETSDEKIEKMHWIPIAVLGLVRAKLVDSFAEMSHRGFLAYVHSDPTYKTGSIIWFHSGQIKIVANKVTDLKLTLPEIKKEEPLKKTPEQIQKLRDSLEANVKKSPEDFGVLANYANFLIKHDDFSKALSVAEIMEKLNAKQKNPKNFQLAYPQAIRGLIFAKSQNLKEAKPFLEKAQSLDAMLVSAFFQEFKAMLDLVKS